jgi:glycosyltransferase involved in cell wall biosynthesis
LTVDLLNSDSNIAWVCLGEGEDLEFLQKLVVENELSDRVFFVGFRSDSRPYYKFFDLFFHPSNSEGFPLVIIDAMSSKTPILIPKLEVYGSILKSDMVYYFDQNCNISLCNGLCEILNNSDQLKQKTHDSFNYYENNLSIEAYGKKYFNLLNDLSPKN